MVTLDRPTATPRAVKHALEALNRPAPLGANPLAQLPVLTPDNPAELRGLLVDVIVELADSRLPREAESGRLLFDYYIRRVGSHELIAERLHLSRPTYFRRLQHGYRLVALLLNGLSDFALWFRL